MPRPRLLDPATIVHGALPLFWTRGYASLSVDELARRTSVHRQALYSAFPDKHALLMACVDAYRETVVSPAVAPLEGAGAGLAEVAQFFEHQIAAAESAGLPGPGCLLVNLMSELAPRDSAVRTAVVAHLGRLRAGFTHALSGAARPGTKADVAALAGLLTATAQGLWSVSRVTEDADELRRPVAALLAMIAEEVAR